MGVTASNILNALIAVSDEAIWVTELSLLSGGRRVDFWTLVPMRSRGFRTTAYEIKVSRDDYRRDTAEKQRGALLWSDRFFYVTPPGIIGRGELPTWAGLMEWDGEKFSIIRKAPKRTKPEPTWELVVSILRNSGDCRRDVALLKAQVAFFIAQNANAKERETIQHKMAFARLLKRNGSATTNPGDGG